MKQPSMLPGLERNQRGVTLVELLVVLPIMAIIVVAAGAVIIDVVKASSSTARMLAFRQVQQAGACVSDDTLMTQQAPNTTQFLALKWTDWESDIHEVQYSLVPSGDLKSLERQEIVNHDTDNPIVRIVAQCIDDTVDPETGKKRTRCEWDEANVVLTFTVTATVGALTETRTYEIKPRSVVL